MHYTPHVDYAFNSVEHIMRDVNYGWLLRYLHANGASMFFLAVYIHMFRGMYYGSYKEPREVLWILGVIMLPADDRDRLHGLRAAVGPDELLGRDRHHQPVLGDPGRRRGDRDLAVGRLRGRQSDAQPLLLAALPAAVRDRRRGRAAHLGAARGRTEQSDRHRAEVRQGHRAVHALRDHQGRVPAVVCSASCSPGSCSTCRTISAMPTTTFRPIRR